MLDIDDLAAVDSKECRSVEPVLLLADRSIASETLARRMSEQDRISDAKRSV